MNMSHLFCVFFRLFIELYFFISIWGEGCGDSTQARTAATYSISKERHTWYLVVLSFSNFNTRIPYKITL